MYVSSKPTLRLSSVFVPRATTVVESKGDARRRQDAGRLDLRRSTEDPARRIALCQTVLGEVLLAIGDHLTAAADTNPMSLLVRNFVIPEGHYRGVASFEGIPGGYERKT